MLHLQDSIYCNNSIHSFTGQVPIKPIRQTRQFSMAAEFGINLGKRSQVLLLKMLGVEMIMERGSQTLPGLGWQQTLS